MLGFPSHAISRLTFEGEKYKPSNPVLFLFRFGHMTPEAKVIVISHREIIMRHNVCIGIRNISTSYDQPCLVAFVCKLSTLCLSVFVVELK
jgi:hypothetical protein